MKNLEIKKNITWVGALDPNLRVFDVIMETEYGSSYNSFLVQGNQKNALFETVKEKFFDEYIEKITKIIKISKIDYIVVNHTEPDHVGSIEKILKINPNITIVGSKMAITFLKNIVNCEFKNIIVKDGDSISLGDKTLEFIMAPFLHWPDSMYTYIKEDKSLITCDSFGAHYCYDEILLSKMENRDNYMLAFDYYFDMIMGPFRQHILKAVDKIKDLDIEMILPGHGPIIDDNPFKFINYYKKLATEKNIFKKKTVLILYVSAYGYTKKIAENLKSGVESESVDVYLYDLEIADQEKLMKEIKWADGILFGSPTINSDALPPIWNILMQMSPLIHGRKLAAAFGSYGWSGEAIPNMEARFKMLRLKQFEEGLKIKFKPSKEELELAFDYGKKFARKL